MTSDQIVAAIVTAVLSGAISAMSAVAAIRVHISWLEKSVSELKQSLTRAHQRIDEMRR